MLFKNYKIPYADLSLMYSKSSVFYHYIHHFDRIKNFYQHDYRFLLDQKSIEKLIESLVSQIQISVEHRKKVHGILSAYNKENRSSAKVCENLDSFLSPNCYTVFTGQQCGLFTGPLYTIYKSITAIQITHYLNRYFKNKKQPYSFIPIFWSASEDHDFTECNHIYFPHATELRRLSLNIEHQNYALGDIDLKDEIQLLVDKLKNIWARTEFSTFIFDLLGQRKLCMSESFKHLMSYLFKDYGLLFIEPHLLRDMSVNINQIAMSEYQQIHRSVQEADELLFQKGYQDSLKKSENDIGIFYFDHKQRRKLIASSQGLYKVSKTDIQFQATDLKKRIQTQPDKFSQNFWLRPIVQDKLFPNVITVCGPGELNYFARLKGIYPIFGTTMPCLYPRLTATVLEKKYQRIQQKSKIHIKQILNAQFQIEDLIQSLPELDELFMKVQGPIEDFKSILKDKNEHQILESLNPYFNKINFEFKRMKEKYLNKVQAKGEISKGHLQKLQIGLLPKLKAQERVYNIFYYLNLYGMDLLKAMMESLDGLDLSHHQVLKDE